MSPFLKLLMAVAIAAPTLAHAQPADTVPLSPAQKLLFDTPHLANVERPEVLRYKLQRVGPGDYTDTIALAVKDIHPDGSKDLAVDYGTGEHHQIFPALDHFRGNPLLMFVLEQNVSELNASVGLSKAYLRNRIRDSFLDGATVETTSIPFGGRDVAARRVTITPFAHLERLERIASLQARRYTFVLSDAVPGEIAEISIDTPADQALQAPALSDRITFAGVEP